MKIEETKISIFGAICLCTTSLFVFFLLLANFKWEYTFTLSGFIIGIGIISIWSYFMLFSIKLRAIWFNYIYFPKLRKKVNERIKPDFFISLVLSYEMSDDILIEGAKSLAKRILEFGVESVVYIAGSTQEDIDREVRIISVIFEKYGVNSRFEEVLIDVSVYHQEGLGKRNAISVGILLIIDIIAQRYKSLNGVAMIVDGDTIFTPYIFNKTAPFLIDPNIYSNIFDHDKGVYRKYGALTCSNRAITKGTTLYALDNEQRMLCRDTDQSGGSTVITGRYAMFGSWIFSNDLARQILKDEVEHSLYSNKLGQHTGDDKTTVDVVRKLGWEILYVPDVYVYCYEPQPYSESFWQRNLNLASWKFRIRVSSNMLKNADRALKSGLKRLGYMIFLKYFDQKYGFWRGIVGPLTIISLFPFFGSVVVHFYLIYLFITRSFLQIVFLFNRYKWFKDIPLVDILMIPFWGWVRPIIQMSDTFVRICCKFFLDYIVSWDRAGEKKVKTYSKVDLLIRYIGIGSFIAIIYGTINFFVHLAVFKGVI